MKSVKLAGVSGVALLLAACGGGAEDAAPQEDVAATPAAEETAAAEAADAPEAAPTAGETPAAEETKAPEKAEPVAKETAVPAPAAKVAAATPPAGFAMCKVCHAVEPGKNGIGPTLAGVFGAKAGHIADFEYSDAMKDSGLTWNATTLNDYLLNPRKVVPGTKMSYAGLKDDAKRAEVIEYLKGL